MNLVIPMAGRGSRFAHVGIAVPKPLIDVRGKPMYAWATDSLPLAHAKRLIFICLAEHLGDLALEEDIHRRYGQYNPVVVGLTEVTQGQACTVLTAKKHIDEDVPLVIFNADTFFTSALSKTVTLLPPHVRGMLGVFKAPGDKWSFVRTDDQGRVVEVAEKKRISDWACTGLYHFSAGAEFVQHAEKMIADNERVNNEFYVAPVYNRLLAQGSELRLDVAEQVWVLGTPEDLAYFEANYPRR